jgi:redox-sensitive bicupin YhaK (pirin superfamily)
MEAGITSIQQIPTSFNAFLYVLEGSLQAGEDEQRVRQDQVGWLNLFQEDGPSELKLTAGEEGVRFVLYAGRPTDEKIVSHGPFIADSTEDIMRLYSEYRQGRMKHISTVDESQRLLL